VNLEDARARLDELDEWRRLLTNELAALPRTLMQLREGVENFQRVTRRLDTATASMEQLTDMQAAAVRAVRDQIAASPGGAMVSGALDELTDALGTLARLNPFWPRATNPKKED
jgi:hypothetical protein